MAARSSDILLKRVCSR